ncbi:GRAM domain-containing protein 3 isoform 5 [Camelus ferus]|nr:GRAM domain-containing protein 3 isoform 5 [Camelus ferus]
MVKKRLQSSSDAVFRSEIPSSASKAGAEVPYSNPDSPGSVFLRCLILMLNRKPLLDLEQGQDIMEAVSQEDESGIDVPEDLERGTLEMAAVCSRGGGDTSAAAAILRCLLHLKAVTEALIIPLSRKQGYFIVSAFSLLWMFKVKRFLFSSSEAENGVEEKKKACRSPTAQSPAPTSEAESQDQKRIISLRSKSSFDGVSLVSEKNDCKTESKNDSKIERKKSSSSSQDKANMHFHKLFLDVPTEEPLRQSFTCALQKEILYQGKLFVSENWICFHSKVFGKDTKNTSIGNSPNPSPLENSFRADRPSSLPLDFNDEFSDLDGVVRQRRQDMEGYSSSGSQTPESENSRESQTVLNVSKGEAKPTRADALVNRVPEGKAKSLPAHGLGILIQLFTQQTVPSSLLYYEGYKGQPETIGIVHRVKSQKCPTLHHILIFYAVVVCALIISTFYMRYRINTLEERLGSLTSIVDTHQTECVQAETGSRSELLSPKETNHRKQRKARTPWGHRSVTGPS